MALSIRQTLLKPENINLKTKNMNEKIIPCVGNYKKLISYQKANAIYCLTYYFIEHYLKKRLQICALCS